MTDGTRSGLWSHMAHAIDVLRPKLVVIENVGGLFSAEATSVMESHPLCLGDDGTGVDTVLLRAIDAVLSTLSELGYDAEWTALRAADVGAPHGRLRVFITAHPQGEPWRVEHGDGRAPADTCSGGSGGWATLPVAGGAGGSDTPTLGAGAGPDAPGSAPVLMPTPGANLGENGGPQHPDKRRAGGHSVSIEDAVHEITEDQAFSPAFAMGATDFGPYTPAIQRWEQVLGRPAPDPTEPGKNRPRLSSRFVEFLMGLDAGHVTDVGLTRNQELKALGNGVVPQQGAAALRHLHHIRTTYLEEMTS